MQRYRSEGSFTRVNHPTGTRIKLVWMFSPIHLGGKVIGCSCWHFYTLSSLVLALMARIGPVFSSLQRPARRTQREGPVPP